MVPVHGSSTGSQRGSLSAIADLHDSEHIMILISTFLYTEKQGQQGPTEAKQESVSTQRKVKHLG
jgi:hypothetical protein